jgi:putative LysE/RhtB family amino acid efflux pump
MFFKACTLGLMISSIFGPITLLFLRKTLDVGVRGALAIGTATSLGNLAYGIVASLGLTAISDFLIKNTVMIKFIGGLFLFFLAYQELMVNIKSNISKSKGGLIPLFLQTLLLTLVSPVTILFFINFFTSFHVTQISLSESLLMIAGIFVGSMLWYTILGGVILIFRKYISEEWLNNTRYFSAFLLIVLGWWSIGSIL